MIHKFLYVGILILINTLPIKTDCPKPYSHCNLGKEGFINVHIVPHTHDDVGWLKTVDEYYYGSASEYQKASVQYILDTVVEELDKDPKKRFVYVEIAFFWRWWNEQTDNIKQIVRKLVDEGRLEFVIGAWCMNDEATTYYTDIIDQQTLGLKFILKEFGECARPRSAWQVDPFGHSREQASLFAQFGFDGLFQGRIDYQDFDHRGDTKTREGLWQASSNLGEMSQLFTGILPNGYGPPPGFCFDIYCSDDPIMDNPSLEDYNVDQKVNDFIKYTYDQQKKYKTSNLIMTMGSDFQYSNAHMWYKNLDKTIKYVNERQITNNSNVNIFYSTPACYLYSLNRANTTWPVKTDDFFPYAHKPHAFWTGYFTSRATLKFYVRRASNILQAARQIASLLRLTSETVSTKLGTLTRAMGVAQHHDAVSGTEKQHVAYDYAKRLSIGINQVLSYLVPSIDNRLGMSDSKYTLCQMLNVSQCIPVEDKSTFATIIYNPLANKVDSWIRIPITDTNDCPVTKFQVHDSDHNMIHSEIVPIDSETKRIPERVSKANHEIVFKANLPPLNTKIYILSCLNSTSRSNLKKVVSYDEPFVLKNKKLQLNFDEKGNLIEIVNLNKKTSSLIKQNYCYYNSYQGNNSKPEFEPSGAYVFRPLSNTPDCLNVANFTVYHGEQFEEVHQIFNEWISQTIRLYADNDNVEFNWQVGPIDVSNNIGKEVIVKFASDLDTNSTFYTDSNGREILKRVRDFRPTWSLNQSEKVAGNYYPVNSRIFLRDQTKNKQLTLVTDRSQGGSSIRDGSVELMLHRITLDDDNLGVGEPLNEKGSDGKGLRVRGSINLIFDSKNDSARLHRPLSHQINSNPLVFVGDVPKKFESLNVNRFGLGKSIDLPANLHLLTLMNDYDVEAKNVLLVRIEHFYEAGEDLEFSKDVTIDLRQVFADLFNVVGVKELALGANMPVEMLNERLQWTPESTDFKIHNFEREEISNLNKDESFEFNFKPMQIRTFHLWIV